MSPLFQLAINLLTSIRWHTGSRYHMSQVVDLSTNIVDLSTVSRNPFSASSRFQIDATLSQQREVAAPEALCNPCQKDLTHIIVYRYVNNTCKIQTRSLCQSHRKRLMSQFNMNQAVCISKVNSV